MRVPSRHERGGAEIPAVPPEDDGADVPLPPVDRPESAEDLEQLRLLENGYEIQTVETDYDSKEVNVESDIPVVEKEMQQERTNGTQ